MDQENGVVTELLVRISHGDRSAEALLMPLVYAELHRQAAARMRTERPSHTLQPTALVNEVYLRLCAREAQSFQNRAHFFAIAANSMRHILVEHARRHQAAARGSGLTPVSLDESIVVSDGDAIRTLEINELLSHLKEVNPRGSQIVEMRFFGGLGESEIAIALGIAERTVRREWVKARAWLHSQVHKD